MGEYCDIGFSYLVFFWNSKSSSRMVLGRIHLEYYKSRTRELPYGLSFADITSVYEEIRSQRDRYVALNYSVKNVLKYGLS